MTTPTLPEWLDIEDEPLATPAIQPYDLLPLRAMMFRGANLPMGDADGTRPYKPVLDELDVTIRWYLKGFHDPDGVPFADYRNGVDENLEFYRALFNDDQDPTTGEKTYTLHLATKTLTAPIQCWSWDPVRTGPATATILTRLVIADGRLVEVT